jgi:cardiolipin synthase
MSRHALPALEPGHHIELLEGGDAYFAALIKAMDAAVQEVRLETYIFHDDASGLQVMQALARASQRGVRVYLMVDGLGTPRLPADWLQVLSQAGVQVLQFRPLGKWGVLLPGQWRRLHRKLALIDHELAFCGGINVLDDWVEPGQPPLTSPRFDFAVAVRGPLVAQVGVAMKQLWWRARAVQSARDVDFRAGWEALQHVASAPASVATPHPAFASSASNAPKTLVRAALLLRDNVGHRTQIERAYRKAIGAARQDIIIANAYFLPARRLRQALIRAAQRGVKVRLLLLAQFSWPLQAHAVRWIYRPLIEAGVEIHEYASSFLHAKVAVVDGQWATVGSSNLDPLSLLLAREANVVVQDPVFGAQLRERLLHALVHDGRVVDRAAVDVPLWSRCLDHVAFALLRLMVAIAGRRY